MYVAWWRLWMIWAGLGDGEAIQACLGAQVQVTQPVVIQKIATCKLLASRFLICYIVLFKISALYILNLLVVLDCD